MRAHLLPFVSHSRLTHLPPLQGLIFVIDSGDRQRIDEARSELERILADREMRDCLLLVFANKQDLPGAMSPSEVNEKLCLHKMKDRSWYVHPR